MPNNPKFTPCKPSLGSTAAFTLRRKSLALALGLSLMMPAQAMISAPAQAQALGAAERAAARAAVRAQLRSAERRTITISCRGIPQKCAGLRREEAARRILASRYPNERIQAETYLRNPDGSIARDYQTGTARRIDFVMFADGRVSRRFEITSQHADKRDQLAKEMRIFDRQADGRRRTGRVYVRDRETDGLVPIDPRPSQLMRFN